MPKPSKLWPKLWPKIDKDAPNSQKRRKCDQIFELKNFKGLNWHILDCNCRSEKIVYLRWKIACAVFFQNSFFHKEMSTAV